MKVVHHPALTHRPAIGDRVVLLAERDRHQSSLSKSASVCDGSTASAIRWNCVGVHELNITHTFQHILRLHGDLPRKEGSFCRTGLQRVLAGKPLARVPAGEDTNQEKQSASRLKACSNHPGFVAPDRDHAIDGEQHSTKPPWFAGEPRGTSSASETRSFSMAVPTKEQSSLRLLNEHPGKH